MTNLKNWEERFDEKFIDPMQKKHGEGFALYCSFCDGSWREEIKKFVASELHSLAEGMIGVAHAKTFPERESDEFDAGYKQAIEDTLTAQKKFIKDNLE